MYIIVVGGGKVGYYLAKELVEEGNEVLIIEKDAAKAERIAEELGDISLRGDGCEASTMEMAGFGRADMVIAVTGDDEDNLVTCQVAKAKFKVPRTIARINNPKNEEIFKKLGIDTTVSATTAILSQIEQELPTHPLIPLLTLKGGGLEIVEVKVPENSAVVGKRIAMCSCRSSRSSPSSWTRTGSRRCRGPIPCCGRGTRWWRSPARRTRTPCGPS